MRSWMCGRGGWRGFWRGWGWARSRWWGCACRGARRWSSRCWRWKAGAAYLPVDPGLPGRADGVHAGGCAGGVVLVWGRPGRCWMGCRPGRCGRWSWMTRGWRRPSRRGRVRARRWRWRGGQLAYVIYTSGSTGAPKGVTVTHGGLAKPGAAQARCSGRAGRRGCCSWRRWDLTRRCWTGGDVDLGGVPGGGAGGERARCGPVRGWWPGGGCRVTRGAEPAGGAGAGGPGAGATAGGRRRGAGPAGGGAVGGGAGAGQHVRADRDRGDVAADVDGGRVRGGGAVRDADRRYAGCWCWMSGCARCRRGWRGTVCRRGRSWRAGMRGGRA